MAAAGSSPASLAAAVQAGVDPKRAQRIAANNQYLAQVLQQIAGSANNIRTPTGLITNLLAEAVARSGKNQSDLAVADIQRQIAAAKFPNSPSAQLDYLTDPEDVDKARATAYQTQDVRQGNTLHNGTNGQDYTAPIYFHDDGVFGSQGPQGVTIQGTRPAGITENMTAGMNSEVARHNAAEELIGNLQAQAAQQQAQAATVQAQSGQLNAGTNQGQLGLGQSTAPTYAPPAGFIIGHPGASR